MSNPLSKKVSTSEALALSCERKHMYGFHPGYNLEPKSYGLAINRGVTGHEALAAFFSTFQKTGKLEEAKVASALNLAESLSTALSTNDANKLTAITELQPLLIAYYDSKLLHDFLSEVKILAVEESWETLLPNGTVLPIRVDLLVYYEKGQYKGETVPVDNKFVYNFWKESSFRMNSQFPNYIYILRDNFPEAVITRGMVNQLRWRSNAKEMFDLTPIRFNRKTVSNVVDNHMLLAEKAIRLRNLPLEVAQNVVTRSLSKYSCDNCSYNILCEAELTEKDAQSVMTDSYQPNTYGYDKEDSSND